jgi:CubicO group peptidase (beta-lactamase class C family)
MTADTTFPIHSVTKTITSVAVMMLVDQGKIALGDPVSKYIPSFAGMKVGVERKDNSGRPVLDPVPPRRPINIEDLLLHTSGITFYGEGLVKAAYNGIATVSDLVMASASAPIPAMRCRRRARSARSNGTAPPGSTLWSTAPRTCFSL